MKNIWAKIRKCLISFIAGNDLVIVANVKFDGKNGFVVGKDKHALFKNVEISNCEAGITIN